MFKKLFHILSVTLVIVLLLSACAPAEEEKEVVLPPAEEPSEEVEEEVESEPYKVGWIPPALVSPFYIVLTERIEEIGDENPNIEVFVSSPTVQTAIEEQVKIVEDMIQKEVDLIAIATSNWEALAPALKQARDAGIEVVQVDRVIPVEGLDTVSMLGSDEIEGGRYVGEFVADYLDDEGKVAVLTGVAGSYHSERRLEGFYEIMDEKPGIEIVSVQPANWQRELGLTTMENILQSNPDLDLVWGLNDNMALGALTAIQQAGLTDQIAVVGYNGDQEALEKIKSGELLATAKSQPVKIAEAIMLEVVPLLMDGKRGEVQSAYPVHVVLTTQENVDQFLDQ